MDAKRVAESAIEMNEIVLPSDSNALGTAFGGKVVQWIDVCAAMAAQRHCRTAVVTAAIDALDFHSPIRIGMITNLRAEVTATFRRSLEVMVEVHSEDPISGVRQHCCSAMLTFAALGDDSRPTEVPPLLLESEAQRQRQTDADERRRLRLAARVSRR